MSFSASSSNISLEGNSTLKAMCRRIDGSWSISSLNLNDYIMNDDGHLKWGGKNFAESSTSVYLTGTVLHATCRTCDGKWKESSINLDERVGNSDGSLV